jgi:hypothetical protein
VRRRRSNRDRGRNDKQVLPSADRENTHSPAPNSMLDLQRTIGNRAVSDLLDPRRVQVSQPGDAAEVEADRVSHQIAGTSKSEPAGQPARTSSAGTPSQSVSERSLVPDAGEPLESTVRAGMEKQLGHEFSGVRIHTGERAAESARSLGARAYTLGKDVVFDAGEYAPRKQEGKQLLAHELTHVVQQGAAPRTSSAEASPVKSAPQVPAGKVIQRQPKPQPTTPPPTTVPSTTPSTTPSTSPSTTPSATPAAPQLTQAFYDQAIALLSQMPTASGTIVAILKQGKVGQTVSGVKIVNSGPQTATPNAPPAQISFDLNISTTVGNLRQGAAAQFVEDPANQTNIQANPVKGIVITRLLQIIAKPAASANDMAWSLLHEGVHMLLGIDRTIAFAAGTSPGVASGSTGTLKSFGQYQQAGKTSSQRSGLVSAMVTEINRVKAASAPPPSAPAGGPSANDVADDVIDEILEERFAFDQQLKQFPGSKTASNSILADAYMFDQLAFGLGLKTWPTPPNRQALVNLMAAFLTDVELILNPPAPTTPRTTPGTSAPPPKKP